MLFAVNTILRAEYNVICFSTRMLTKLKLPMYWVEQSNCAEQKNQAATFKSELKFTVFS